MTAAEDQQREDGEDDDWLRCVATCLSDVMLQPVPVPVLPAPCCLLSAVIPSRLTTVWMCV